MIIEFIQYFLMWTNPVRIFLYTLVKPWELEPIEMVDFRCYCLIPPCKGVQPLRVELRQHHPKLHPLSIAALALMTWLFAAARNIKIERKILMKNYFGVSSLTPANQKLKNGYTMFDWVMRQHTFPAFWGRVLWK